MPHFYLGKHLLSKFMLYYYFLFPAFIFLGIGSVISIIVFICEKVRVKFFDDEWDWLNKCPTYDSYVQHMILNLKKALGWVS